MLLLTGYAGMAAAILLLVVLGIFPRTRWNQQDSYNNLFAVRMQPAAFYTATGQSLRGVHAQERVECFLRWLLALTVIGSPFRGTRWFLRQSELIGHACEVLAAGRDGFDQEE